MNDQPEACSEPKHISLNGAINRLEGTRELARNILHEIQGTPRAVNKEKDPMKPPPPTLQEVLEGGPDRINMFCDEIENALVDIKRSIF